MAGGVSLSLSDCRSVPGKKMGTPHQQLQCICEHKTRREWCPAHLLLDDHDLFGWDVLKGEHKTPVEVTLPVHGAVVHVRLLCLIFTTEPTGWGRGRGQEVKSQTERGRAMTTAEGNYDGSCLRVQGSRKLPRHRPGVPAWAFSTAVHASNTTLYTCTSMNHISLKRQI